ncbi:MAG: ABC transporter permease [Chloroflexi bacterium]|nr:ABC transporter permease [Chloroflexota bacterium]
MMSSGYDARAMAEGQAAALSSHGKSSLAIVLRTVLRFARRKPLGFTGAVIAVLFLLMAAFASFLAPYDPFAQDAMARISPPSTAHLFGTDKFGRDLLSRVIYGARIALYVTTLSMVLASVVGTIVGLTSGYFGGTLDAVLQRLVDALMAFPTLVLAMAIMAVLGPSLTNVALAVAITQMPRTARIMRSTTLSLNGTVFIDAARAVGAGHTRILLRHILPNTWAPLIVISTVGAAWAVVVEASLSFLGIGAPPPNPSWGLMLSGEGVSFIEAAPWIGIFPGIAISVVVFALNLLGDALRDVLDPRLRGS